MIDFICSILLQQGSEWKEKAENLEIELQQCYKAQSRLSEQLVVEVAESRALKAQVQEKEAMITDLQNELNQARFVLWSPLYYYLLILIIFFHYQNELYEANNLYLLMQNVLICIITS